MALGNVVDGALLLVFGALYGAVTLPRTLYRFATGYYARLPGARLRRAAQQALLAQPALAGSQSRLRVNEWGWADPEARSYNRRHRRPPSSAALWLEVSTEESAEAVAPHLPAFVQALRVQLIAHGIDEADAGLVQVGCVTSAEIQQRGGYFHFDRELWPVRPDGRLDPSAAP